jgi:transcriptional regulator with XRE-family HTH domain
MVGMRANPISGAATHFGRQMQKARLANGWSLREMAARTGIDFTTLSRIETGNRPPNERLARACDKVFPERNGWFYEHYEESRTWVPASFRTWAELEERAVTIRAWMPSIFHGLLQTEQYARALLETSIGATPEIVAARLSSRMGRQRRLFTRDAVVSCFVIDEVALYRLVGSTEGMAGQLSHLCAMAALPAVTIQVLPAIAHPATASGFVLADDSAYAEHVVSGGVYRADTSANLAMMFDTLRGECYRVSESLAMMERLGRLWASGVNPLTALQTAGTA